MAVATAAAVMAAVAVVTKVVAEVMRNVQVYVTTHTNTTPFCGRGDLSLPSVRPLPLLFSSVVLERPGDE